LILFLEPWILGKYNVCWLLNWEVIVMAWKSPKVIEIAVGMEINCYACAEL